MKELRIHLPSDLKALSYLDALNARDLEAVAALWEEASHDPELERILAEVDEALFLEESRASVLLLGNRGPLAEKFGQRQRRRAVWAGVVGALAAACLLAVLTWPGRDGKNLLSSHPTGGDAQAPGAGLRNPPSPRPLDGSANVAGLLRARRDLDESEIPPFTWPLFETAPLRASTSIHRDLLD